MTKTITGLKKFESMDIITDNEVLHIFVDDKGNMQLEVKKKVKE